MATEDASAFADFITDLLFTPAPARNFADAIALFFSEKSWFLGRDYLVNARMFFDAMPDLSYGQVNLIRLGFRRGRTKVFLRKNFGGRGQDCLIVWDGSLRFKIQNSKFII